MTRPKRKRRNKSTPEWKELGFRSGFEYEAALNFDQRGIKYDYEPRAITYMVNEQKKYTPDFKLRDTDFYLEFKGWFKPADRKKALLFRESNPGIEIRFVFQNADNKIRKGSKTSYGDWCDKNGFKWANRVVPDHWVNEHLLKTLRGELMT